MTTRKKIWPEFFGEVRCGVKKIEIRFADFELKAGGMLVLEEYDPKTKRYTGRKIEKTCKNVMKVNPMMFYSADEIRKNGLYVIGLG